MNSFTSFCDDLYLDMHINTELDLPTERDPILAFFERIQRQFPAMGSFSRKDSGEYCLEEERDGERFRWVTLELDRIGSTCANPTRLQDAYELHKLVLELAPYMLGVSHLDMTSLDVTFTMDFDYQGNHDEVVAEALFGATAFTSLLDLPHATPIGFSPNVIVALDEDCRTQARIAVEPRTSVYEVRNERYKGDEAISLYFTVRRYPDPRGKFDAMASFRQQCRIAEDIMVERIIPYFAKPLINAIAQRRR
ncbi:MAG TPA: hypothetical protein P5279_10920 [Anaerohalosphaeraceae bacterium]|jgi:hypothetical protein|nr:hypothetical protein [Anaerohalosphaeraceae bacterium]HRT50997.1 hypothetical protein [Anaerohalosphaeraceae bacterium]HRT86983.1 hypothetical protein [Anaerohalosphaeraceae bacterium]